MIRIRFLLLLVLAGCATRHAAPNLATAPIPTLSYAAVLDDGTVTPLSDPITVRYAPYPTASFEHLLRGTGRIADRTFTFSTRTTGTTLAKTTGELITIIFSIEDVTGSDNLPSLTQESQSIRGATVTVVVAGPHGPTKSVNVSLPPSRDDGAKAESAAKYLAGEFLPVDLPVSGLRQNDTIPYRETYPVTGSDRADSFQGKAVLRGKGSYRGRPVIVFDLTGVMVADDQPVGFHSYMFLDTATGVWSHIDGIATGGLSIKEKTGQLSIHIIDDVRF